MRQLFVALFVFVMGLGLLAQDAEARRLGGGRSFGMSRDSGAMKQAAPAPTAPSQGALPAKPVQPGATPQAPAPQPSGMSRWLGPIAGIAAGIGLAALLSHFGMGEGVATMLMLVLLVMAAVFIFRMFMRRNQPQAAFAGGPARVEPMHFEPASPAASTASTTDVPAGFDTEGFLRQAKLNFIRLQAANDAGNLDDLKQFTAPEVYAEIQMQFEERGHAKQETDVQHLEAQLLELVTEGDRHVASVRFFGQIREEAGALPQPFAEVWHLTKPVAGSGGWMVAGIQQIQ